MEQEHKEQMEKIMADMDCPKDFECYKSEFEKLCKAKDNGMYEYANCLESDSSTCSFKFSFGNDTLCHCPVRVYVVNNLNI